MQKHEEKTHHDRLKIRQKNEKGRNLAQVQFFGQKKSFVKKWDKRYFWFYSCKYFFSVSNLDFSDFEHCAVRAFTGILYVKSGGFFHQGPIVLRL